MLEALGYAIMGLLFAFIGSEVVSDWLNIPHWTAGLLLAFLLLFTTAVIYKYSGQEKAVVCKPPCECLCPEEIE